MKIIITDANSRKAFDIINILQKYNHELLLFSSTGYRFPLPLIYRQKVHRLRSEKYSEFRNDLLSIIKKNKDETYIYMPVSEETTLCFYEFLKENMDFDLRSLLPRKDIFELVRDKKQFQTFCEENDIPVPLSYSRDTFSQLEDSFQPVIAKKKIGAGSVGMKYIESPEQLKILEGINHDEYFIQEKVESGKKIHGGFFLCKDGDVKVYHGHERIRTFPENGGVTVFSKAAYDEDLKRIGQSLLQKLNWNGFAMVEFLYDDQKDEWIIIELNPRLWGSVMLAEYCQSLLLNNYIKLLRNENIVKKEIQTNRYIRWIFPFELMNLLKGTITLQEFFNRSNLKICYINFTYSSFYSALIFQLYFTFNRRSIKRFFKKILS